MEKSLAVSPKSILLRAHQSQAFEVSGIDPTETVKWSIEPKAGEIDEDKGVYKAPPRFWIGKRITVTATCGTRVGHAQVELSAVVFWTWILGLYWVLLAGGLFAIIIGLWADMCPVCKPPDLVISPPIVTLTAGRQQQFTANRPVSWANPIGPTGLYAAPASIQTDQVLTVTAMSTEDAGASSSALIALSPGVGISIHPQSVVLEAGGTLDFSPVFSGLPAEGPPPEVEWLPPAAGKISPQGKYEAPPEELVRRPNTVQIVARTTVQPPQTAAANVTVVPPGYEECAGKEWGLLLLIALLGAVGGLIHGASSFAVFTGNRQLRVSWIWWYALKPILGALVALVFYLVYRAGFGGNDVGLSTADCMKVGALAGLVGLFSEPATLKLKEIFDTVFTVKRDPRGDHAQPGGEAPRIAKVEPASVKKGTEPPAEPLVITGENFSPGCVVTVNDVSRAFRYVTPTELKVSLTASDIASPGALGIKVINPTGQASDTFQVAVTP